jgi:hypothetical protein
MDLSLIVAFTLAVVALCIGYFRSKAKRGKPRAGYDREEMHIDAENVPEFKPTWRNTR